LKTIALGRELIKNFICEHATIPWLQMRRRRFWFEDALNFKNVLWLEGKNHQMSMVPCLLLLYVKIRLAKSYVVCLGPYSTHFADNTHISRWLFG